MEKVQAKSTMKFLIIATIATVAVIMMGVFIAFRGILNPSNAPNVVAGTQLPEPEVLRIGDSLVWDDVDNAVGYGVKVEDEDMILIPIGDPKIFMPDDTILNNPDIYNIQIIAIGNGVSFFDSITTVEYIVTGTLEHISNKVIHTFDEGTLTHSVGWDRVPNAARYIFSIDGASEVVLQTEAGVDPHFEFHNDHIRPGTHAISVVAVGNGIVWFDSEPLDDEIYISPRVLDQAQNISFIEGTISWRPVEFAKKYEIEFSTGEVIEVVNTKYDLTAFIGNNYGIFEGVIRAIYSVTVFSEANFVFIVPRQLNAPSDVAVNGQTISWTSNDIINAFRIEIDGSTGFANSTSFVWGQEFVPGSTYDIYIYTVAGGDQTGIYLESEVCHYVYNAPKLTVVLASVQGLKVDANVVSWDAVVNANGYRLMINAMSEDIFDTSFEFEFLGGEYDIRVIALGGKESTTTIYCDSVHTRFIYRILAAVSLNNLNSTIFWTAVTGATAYAIYVDGVQQKDRVYVTDNRNLFEFDLVTHLGLAEGAYDIQIVAIGGVVFANSNLSQTIRVQIGPATPPPDGEQRAAGISTAVTAVLAIAGAFALIFIGYLTVVKVKKQRVQ